MNRCLVVVILCFLAVFGVSSEVFAGVVCSVAAPGLCPITLPAVQTWGLAFLIAVLCTVGVLAIRRHFR